MQIIAISYKKKFTQTITDDSIPFTNGDVSNQKYYHFSLIDFAHTRCGMKDNESLDKVVLVDEETQRVYGYMHSDNKWEVFVTF